MKKFSFKNNQTDYVIAIITVLSIVYSIVRYNIYGDVAWKDLPVFVFNKAISLSAIILLILTFSLGPLQNMGVQLSENLLKGRKTIGIVGFIYAFIHLFLSISILNPKYYPNYFIEDETLSLRGGLSLFGGILGFTLLWVYNISFKPSPNKDHRIIPLITSKKFILVMMILLSIHLFFLGYSGWLTINKWPGKIPPISLLSFVIINTGLIINWIGRK